ncbi:hypothetical protein GCM10011584_26550 [Nocardioides phosphati]|uniref:ESX-1 secretion-associated protein n=1 Tax=Nocardioides phosphati TaxID=1867775 RepID=A0ABQ2NDD9_9ACTN|nr:hypothetical protein [Nocardioides phosphati]GGO91743.1 hypothetical protein GCM10011584_26550 [Nocardioides phosphati]
MTNGFSVDPGELPDTAVVLAAAGSGLRALSTPRRVDAGRSSDEIAAAVLQVVQDAASVGGGLTALAAAFEAAARSYAATDAAVAEALQGWGD